MRRAAVGRIDEAHANPKAGRRRTGSPECLRPADVERLEEARRPRPGPVPWRDEGGGVTREVGRQAHAVAAVTPGFGP